ncbi:hypothetical protein Q5H89_18060 [Hymenobacter sp. CA2-7]|nr:hypothetical protein [Hymenobacter sp. CA2-7]
MNTLLAAIFYTPTTTHASNGSYYFTQQEYGFVTMTSSGYNLTFYRQQPFWLDQEIGKVQLECAGSEAVQATLALGRNGYFRLRIATDNQERLDTTLRSGVLFNFRRTSENHTLDFSKRH